MITISEQINILHKLINKMTSNITGLALILLFYYYYLKINQDTNEKKKGKN